MRVELVILGLSLPWPAPPEPPAGTSLGWYVAAMCLAVVVIGIAKAGFGGGIGILAVPLTATALPAGRAIGVMLPILIVADVFSNLHHARTGSWPHLRWLLTGSVAGIAVGSAVLWWLGQAGGAAYLQTTLSALVGGICLAMVALQCVRLAGWELARVPPGPWGGRGAGLITGVASTLAHSAGPIASVYLLEQRLDKVRHVGTMVLLFFVVNLLKVPTYVGLGLITPATLVEAAWFVPLVPVGTVLGVWMHRRIPEKPFAAVVYVGAALAAGHLLWKAVG